MQSLMQISPSRKTRHVFHATTSLFIAHPQFLRALFLYRKYTTSLQFTYALLRFIADAEEFSKGAIVLHRGPTNFLNCQKKRTQTPISQRLARHQRSKM